MLSCKWASKSKRKRENPQSKIGGKQKKRKKKENFPIKDWRKAKERKRKFPDQRSEESKSKIYRKVVGLGNVWIMYKIVTSKREKKRNHHLRHIKLPLLVTNQIVVPVSLSHHAKQKKRNGKGRNAQSQTHHSYQNPKSIIAHIIFHFMGNDLQSQIMTCLWFGVRMKQLPVWDFIHFERFLIFQLDPVFSSNALLEMKCKCLKSHLWLWEILSTWFPSLVVTLFFFKNICCSDWFGGFVSLLSVFAF